MKKVSKVNELLVPLVGAHFRPPAKQVLAHSAAGGPLFLELDPTNPYDEKAIKVMGLVGLLVPVGEFGGLASALVGTGFELEDLLVDGESGLRLHLGFIADSDGRQLAGTGLPGNREVRQVMEQGEVMATLAFGADGKPAVRISRVQGDEGEG